MSSLANGPMDDIRSQLATAGLFYPVSGKVKEPTYGLSYGGYSRSSTTVYHAMIVYCDGIGAVPYRGYDSGLSKYFTVFYHPWF